MLLVSSTVVFFFQAEDGIRDGHVTGVQTCALPISLGRSLGGRVLGQHDQGGQGGLCLVGIGLVGDEGVGAQGRTLDRGGQLLLAAAGERHGGGVHAGQGSRGRAEGQSQLLFLRGGEILLTDPDQQQGGGGGQSVGGDAVDVAPARGGVQTGDGLGGLGGARDGGGGHAGHGHQ